MNFDASFEYYLKNAGIVSVGIFHKNIDNPVYRNSYTLRNTVYEGRTYCGSTYPGRKTRTPAA
ncbi:MAG: hypothetical protein H7A44_08305 [Opitutaceae bacterium]|nr:hypothetical protein [Opitutaceae bacterium]